ncbi:hypothetical protein HanRHA438_Chr05g0222231 [Helianthus annuus]|nr:hypothetical protein HanIR_Chr05g0229121 [Helianthus annuus]KAJ0918805.1 hypothetical protein HanRHA438_Chr05g0222231 [Helianthus annuus]
MLRSLATSIIEVQNMSTKNPTSGGERFWSVCWTMGLWFCIYSEVKPIRVLY